MGKLLVLFACLTFLHVGTCLNCYVCSSYYKNDTCTDPFDREKHQTDICDDPKSICVKERLHSVGFRDSVHRGCFPADYCTEIGSKSMFCGTCEKDKCNSSPSMLPTFIVLAAFILRLFV